MDTYKHILVAVDLSDSARQVVMRAKQLAEMHTAPLSLVHIVEPVVSVPGQELFPSVPVEYEQVLQERGENFLSNMDRDLNLGAKHKLIRVGSIKNELFKLTTEYACDLIVLGTHGRHGIGLLLGSTANAVLHGTPCDVLAVRIHD